MPTLKSSDLWQWLAVNEERLLLHDGLVRLVDHIAVPSGVAEVSEDDFGLPVLDGKNPAELAEIIRKECGTKTTTYVSLMEYRLNALRGLWQAVQELEQKRASSVGKEMGSSSHASGSQGASFASRVSLVLIFPIMKSLSKFDPNLSSEAASILLESLRACEPLTLSNEPADCISGLENLLRSWLNTVQESADVPVAQVQNAASALVALSVAVGTGSLLLRTVHMLQSLKSSCTDLRLLVPGILGKLLRDHVTLEDTSAVLGDAHLQCWGYDDGLVHDGKEGSGPRSIAFSGQFVYLTSSSLKYLLKMGTGKNGTIRGLVYVSREVEPGWVVWVESRGLLLHRRVDSDEKEPENFCALLNSDTLKSAATLKLVGGPSESLQTLHLMSDGMFLYWLYALKTQETVPHPVTGERVKQYPVYVQALEIKGEGGELCVEVRGERVLLQRGGLEEKSSDVVKALVRANPSYASTAISSLLGSSKDDSSGATSAGLSLKVLQSSAAYATGSSLILFITPPTSGSGRSLFSPSSGLSNKALLISLCFSLQSGKFLSQGELSPNSQFQCALTKGASTKSMAACYDSRNHCVWTSNNDWLDIWDCSGKVRVAAHHLASRLGKTSVEQLIPPAQSEQESIPVSEAISLMLRHIGIESCRLMPGYFELPSTVAHNLPLAFLAQCCDLLDSSLREGSWGDAQAVVVTLQAVLPAFLSGSSERYPAEDLATLKDRVRSLAWSLLTSTECSGTLLTETRRLIGHNSEALFLNHKDSAEFIDTLLRADSSQPVLVDLRNELLLQVATSLHLATSLSPHMARVSKLLTANLISNSVAAIKECFECPAEELQSLIACSPVFSPNIQCASALLNVTLRSLVLATQGVQKEEASESSKEVETTRAVLLELCEDLELFNACRKTLVELCEQAASLPPESEDDNGLRQLRLQAVERVTKGTVLGCLLPPLLAVVSDSTVCTLQMANTLQKDLSGLAQLAAQACGLLYGSSSELSSIKIPAPWALGRLVETIHPIRDNYKFKETVSFPGARNLYLKFDSRCSSQYDYDKVIVFAGDSTTAPKVAEYGGNTHGFGSRSVLGKGWPKDLIKVEGDTVTFTFEMKSGREHSTPDRAMWGFSCTVRPQESTEDSPTGLPFAMDLYLSLASVCCSLIGRLYAGPRAGADELRCQQLLNSELLQRCVWPVLEELSDSDSLPLDVGQSPITRSVPRKPLPPVVIQRLRELAGKPQPTLRPSTRELLQPEALEEVVVGVCLKQYGLESALRLLGQPGAGGGTGSGMNDHRILLEAILTRVNGLERRLQALAELERNWWQDMEDIAKGSLAPTEAFFFSLLQHENSIKSFELLCCLKDVQVNQNDLFATAQQLQDMIELDVEKRKTAGEEVEPLDYTPVTRGLVRGVMERAQLLLNVTISSNGYSSPAKSTEQRTAKDDTLTITSPTSAYARSISAPPLTAEFGIRRQRSGGSRSRPTLLDVSTSPDKSNLLDQIFQFIGSKPEEAVSCDSFLTAAGQQWQRGVCRVRALGYLHQLLTSRHVSSVVEHLLASVGAVLQQGPRVSDIACGGMAQPVREAFANIMHAVVELASKQPAACINTIAMLCIVPYTRLEESCLVRSGLVKLLDRLCSLVDGQRPLEVGGEEDDAMHRVTSLAWAAFQVLADHCVSWETESSGVVSSGLAQQVSMLLTNHLSRAMESLVVSETGASEGLQDALSLLLGLAKSHMGRAILSQPACVSRLLLLLTDQRPSPKLVLIALQLCRIALPLMSMVDCSQVAVPPHPSLPPSRQTGLAADIVGLLLAKLAEYIVPDASQVTPKQSEGGVTSLSETESQVPHKAEDEFDESGQASVYVYKRENESAAEILQPLISQDPRQFRLSGHRMQEVMQMDRALTEHGRAEVVTDSYRACLRRALRWANMGFTVSVGPPSGGSGEPSGSIVDKKKAQAEAAAKKKNLELLKSDPPRPFVSGHVAYSLASEVIGLLHGLLTEPGAAEVWSTAIKEALLQSLLSVPDISPKLLSYTKSVHGCVATGSSPPPPGDLLHSACIANATFAALGGFKESVRVGMKVQVIGDGIQDSYGVIQSISERRGVANVQFTDDDYCFGPSKSLEAPLSRLLPPQKETLPLKQLGVGDRLCQAIAALLDTSTPSITHAHSSCDANTPPLGLCRLFAELRSRACMALAYHVRDEVFSQLFLSHASTELLGQEARDCGPGLRLSVVESHCQGLRMLYRDCARPAPPRLEKPRTEPKRIKPDLTRQWPPVASCSFTHHLSSVVYQGPTASSASSSGGGASGSGGQDTSQQPKGVVIYANTAIPSQAPSFYWELEVLHLGDSSPDAAHLAMGYSPNPQKPAEGEPWAFPQDACFIRSSGRGCQVRGEGLLEWNTFRVDTPLKNSDVVGCGWVKGEESKGTVYFTLNGEKLTNEFQDAPPEMLPFLHIQKKAIRVRMNFGERPFVYGDGREHRDAANVQEQDTTEEVAANFGALPFAMGGSESEGEEGGSGEGGSGEGSVIELAQTGPPTRKLKTPIATVGYNMEASQGYHTLRSFDSMLESGPLIRPTSNSQEESEDEGPSAPPEEDLHALLVKAWETKVFPVIQRRFRNDQERKSGLDQIKGALQLGMESIAQETVEFLYEENGGIPKDLHLPTMDDVKADLGRFTISRVRKGSAVVVQKELPYARCGVRTMQKTQGLTGVVLDVDESNQLVQVECYLQNEGALVRFWYPVVYLEKPPPGYRKSPSLRGSDAANMLVHRELLRCEASLTSIYCRRALLTIRHSTSPALGPALQHLRLVANECFAEPHAGGTSTTTSTSLSSSPAVCLQTLSLSPLNMFFATADRLCAEISAAIEMLSAELEGLAQEVCSCLQKAPQDFGYAEMKVAESKEAADVSHPNATFMIVSCVTEKSDSSPPPSSTYKYPWARVLCHRGGQGKGGKQQLQEVARYPSEMAQSSSNQYCGPAHPSLVLPFSRIHVKLGGCSTKPGRMLSVLSLPADFPLALAFVHVLTQHACSVCQRSQPEPTLVVCSRALSICAESLSKLLTRLDCPLPLKETLLQQLSEVLWTLCSIAPAGYTPCSLPGEFLQSIRQELLKVYDSEVSGFPSSKSKEKAASFPPPGSIGDGGSGKFSTYFQALLEFFLAVVEFQQKFHESEIPSTPTTPTVPDPAKKTAKRTRSRKGIKKEAEVDPKKKEEWLNVVRSATSLLRGLALDGGETVAPQIQEASVASSLPAQPNSRLLVLTALDSRLNVESTESAIRRICHTHGGLYRDQLYLPVEEIRADEKKQDEDEVLGGEKGEGSVQDQPQPAAESAGESAPDQDQTQQSQDHAPQGQDQAPQGQDQAPQDQDQAPQDQDQAPRSQDQAPQIQDHAPQDQASQSQDQASQDQDQASQSHDQTPRSQEERGGGAEQTGRDQDKEPRGPPSVPPPPRTHQLVGHAVLELCCSNKVSAVSSALLNCPALQPEDGNICVTAVSNGLACGEDEAASKVMAEYLRRKLVQEGALTERARRTLAIIFGSCLAPDSSTMVTTQVENDLKLFLSAVADTEGSLTELVERVWQHHGGEEKGLGVEGFLGWVLVEVEGEGRTVAVWRGLFACGYDLHFERCGFSAADALAPPSSPAQDQALVQYVDSLCRHLALTADTLQPWDITLTEASLTSQQLAPLQGMSLSDVRLRFLQLKHINLELSLLLPAVDLRSTHALSLGPLLSKMAHLLFYDVKISFLHAVLNASTRRSLDQAPPEVKMDPLESMTGIATEALGTQFCQAAQQMLSVPSPKLCVPLASGGDPTYAFNVKLAGEEVHGTSGSFRHFLWQVVRELQSSVLPILLPCSSGAAGINKGKCILAPGDMTYSEEKLLHFFGQLLGVAIRADMPVALDLLPCFWKCLRGEGLTLGDLREADCITYNLTQKMLECTSPEEFEELLSGLSQGRGEEVEGAPPYHQGELRFTFIGLDGVEVELCPGGKEKSVMFSNREDYMRSVRDFRLRELACEHRMTAVRCGLASVIPLQLLAILTAQDLDLRVCGLPDVDLEYLKRHTMYQVGLMETDKHVQFFWNALESFSQDELRKFIKFACNQERIPFGHPCREGAKDSAMHVPPYPMKIAPPDGKGPPDSRYIRAETCMFMIKLPQYSSQEIMTERLRYAVHCREDPLSG